jgi:hypothetical protein
MTDLPVYYVYQSSSGELVGSTKYPELIQAGQAVTAMAPPSLNTPNTKLRWDGVRWEHSSSLFIQAGIPTTVERLWCQADMIVNTAVDNNARARYLAWLIDPTTSTTKQQRIKQVLAWADSVWTAYRAAKTAVQAGDLSAELPELAPCPYTFWDIADTP